MGFAVVKREAHRCVVMCRYQITWENDSDLCWIHLIVTLWGMASRRMFTPIHNTTLYELWLTPFQFRQHPLCTRPPDGLKWLKCLGTGWPRNLDGGLRAYRRRRLLHRRSRQSFRPVGACKRQNTHDPGHASLRDAKLKFFWGGTKN